MKNIISRILPIDIIDRKASGITIDGLFKTFSKGDEIIDLLVGYNEIIKGDISYGSYCFFYIIFREIVLFSFKGNVVNFFIWDFKISSSNTWDNFKFR